MRSWVTSKRTDAPGRIVTVGWTSRLRWVIWSPARATFIWADWRIACTRSLPPEIDSSELWIGVEKGPR